MILAECELVYTCKLFHYLALGVVGFVFLWFMNSSAFNALAPLFLIPLCSWWAWDASRCINVCFVGCLVIGSVASVSWLGLVSKSFCSGNSRKFVFRKPKTWGSWTESKSGSGLCHLYCKWEKISEGECTLLSNACNCKVGTVALLLVTTSVNLYQQSSRLLGSSSQSLLHVPRIKTDFGRRAFSSAAPQSWNYHIPTAIRVSPSLDSFKHHVKTHYPVLCLAITLTT